MEVGRIYGRDYEIACKDVTKSIAEVNFERFRNDGLYGLGLVTLVHDTLRLSLERSVYALRRDTTEEALLFD